MIKNNKRYFAEKHFLKKNKVRDTICSISRNIDETVEHMNILYNKYVSLKNENEQLKADNNRLVNETARIVAEHQKKVLDLIDKRIDKCEPIDYARNIEGDFPVFDCETATEIRVLNELKKELE